MPSKKPKLTPWFPGHIKPLRPGVYERRSSFIIGQIGYSLWSGQHWYVAHHTPKEAARVDYISVITAMESEWRGLAEPPKEK